MSSGHDAHSHDAHGHDAHGHDSHGHGAHATMDPAEARDVIADFGFYAASTIAGVAFLLQAFVGTPGAPAPRREGHVEHAVSAIHEGH